MTKYRIYKSANGDVIYIHNLETDAITIAGYSHSNNELDYTLTDTEVKLLLTDNIEERLKLLIERGE